MSTVSRTMKALIGIAVVASSIGVAGAASASTSDITCKVTAYAPTYSSPSVSAKGTVSCTGTVAEMSVYVKLTENGTNVGSTGWTDFYVSSMSDVAKANNHSGNQTWCSVVTGEVNGGNIGTKTACETQAWAPPRN